MSLGAVMMNQLFLSLTETVASGDDFGNMMNSQLSFGERIATGLKVMLFGMAVVFSVLILIWMILALFKVIFYEIPKRKNKAASEKVTVEVLPEAEVPVAETAETADNEEEIVAAITAALSVMLECPKTSFRVVSFRRTASK